MSAHLLHWENERPLIGGEGIVAASFWNVARCDKMADTWHSLAEETTNITRRTEQLVASFPFLPNTNDHSTHL